MTPAMTTPFITINIDGPPTLHKPATVRDLLAAAKTLEDYALSLGVTPTPAPQPAEDWTPKESTP